jgi:hypothetical protein
MVREMSDIAALTTLFRDFIADETAAYPSEQGGFWPSNHHRIRPALAKIPLCLAPEERVKFYFYYLRASTFIPPVSESEFPYLVAAYRELLPSIDERYPNLASRLDMLFAFGFDDESALPPGETVSASELNTHLKTLTQTTKYTSLPAQRQKRDRFKPFEEEATRIIQTFRHLGYQHNPRRRDYTSTNLTFWGLALIALLNPHTRPSLISDMLEGPYDIPERSNYLYILNETVQATAPEIAGATPDLQALTLQLQEVTKNSHFSV